jgi:hypothetical protein
MPADLEQRQHQRGELVAQGNAGEADLDVGAGPGDGEGGPPGVIVAALVADLIGQARDLLQQLGQLSGFRPVVEGWRSTGWGSSPCSRYARQLGGQIAVEHSALLVLGRRVRRAVI